MAWELYGPGEEDYTYRAPALVQGPVRPHPGGGHTAEVAINLTEPGQYRVRAATTDLAGRSDVTWATITATDPQ